MQILRNSLLSRATRTFSRGSSSNGGQYKKTRILSFQCQGVNSFNAGNVNSREQKKRKI